MYEDLIYIVSCAVVITGIGFCIEWAHSRDNIYGVIALVLLFTPVVLFSLALCRREKRAIMGIYPAIVSLPAYGSINSDMPPIYEVV